MRHNPFAKSVNGKIEHELETYMKTVLLSGVTPKHAREVRKYLVDYLGFCGNCIDLDSTIGYLTDLKSRYAQVSYNKHYFQIKKFLNYLDAPFVKKIPKVKQAIYTPQKIEDADIQQLLNEHKNDRQMTALIMLGISSGARPLEMYQLRPSDFNLLTNSAQIKEDEFHHVKNKSSVRTIFYDKATSEILKEYLGKCSTRKRVFAQKTIMRKMKNSQTKIKMLRHYMARQCSIKGVPSGITKRFLGHSINNDILESHYNYLSNDDLHNLYNKYFGGK